MKTSYLSLAAFFVVAACNGEFGNRSDAHTDGGDFEESFSRKIQVIEEPGVEPGAFVFTLEVQRGKYESGPSHDRGVAVDVVVTDSLGQVRAIDPICVPIQDISLSPNIKGNKVELTYVVTWDQLSDNGDLMEGAADLHISAEIHENMSLPEMDQHDVTDATTYHFDIDLPARL